MRTFNLFTLAVLTAVFLVACGDDVTKVTEVSKSGLEVVASADSLGKCTAASSGEMKFVSKDNAVYVCSDSGWKNVSAAENVSCSAELLKDSSGFKIVCDGDSVGVMRNGKDGLDGKKGEAGAAGTSCTVEESPLLESDFGRGAYLVVCGGDTVGTLLNGRDGEGCSLTDNGDGSVSQVCGADTVNLYKAFCGGKVYDPDSSICYADSLVALCNGDRFDPEAQFCHENALYEKCLGETYDPRDSVCHEERLFGFFEDNRDGQVYRTVQIGDQTWMAENLNYAYMPDTLSFCYNNSADSCAKYGRLYIWAAAMDSLTTGCGYDKECSPAYPVRGACPDGWHLPDATEWSELEKFVADSLFDGGSDFVGYALKSASGWAEYNGITGGSDSFGFGALPTGYRYSGGTFDGVLRVAYFWVATEYSAYYAYYRGLYYNYTDLYTNGNSKELAMSVRCVKD